MKNTQTDDPSMPLAAISPRGHAGDVPLPAESGLGRGDETIRAKTHVSRGIFH